MPKKDASHEGEKVVIHFIVNRLEKLRELYKKGLYDNRTIERDYQKGLEALGKLDPELRKKYELNPA